MRNVKLTIQYDGSRYDGWQRLGKGSGQTVQGKIEAVLSKMTGEAIEISGSGRTDAGVHALAQIANFHTDSKMSCDEILTYLNHYLPEDIRVYDVEDVNERFHSRLNAASKVYMYRIATDSVFDVFSRKYVWLREGKLDISAMKRAAALLVGVHDFKAFSSVKKTKKSTVREIYSIEIQELEHEVRFTFCGSGFLYNMIRIMTGTLVEVGEGKRSLESMTEILESKNRELAGITAPPQGLCLVEVGYN